MSRRKLTNEDYSAIITRKLVYGQNTSSVARDVGVSDKTVKVVTQAFSLVRDKDFDAIIAAVDYNGVTPMMVEWAARELKTAAPMDEINAAYERRLKRNRDRNKENAMKRDNEAETVEEIVEEKEERKSETKEEKNEKLYMLKILEALAAQNELLEQLLDVVIPKYVSDMKDNLNANTDVICERLKNCEQSLDAIRCNSRKRGL